MAERKLASREFQAGVKFAFDMVTESLFDLAEELADRPTVAAALTMTATKFQTHPARVDAAGGRLVWGDVEVTNLAWPEMWH